MKKILQAEDAKHHMHPFTDGKAITKTGARIITKAKGAILTDIDGIEILDAMAGLWCTNIGYGREDMAKKAYDQIKELNFYNTFFQTTTQPTIELAKKISELTPEGLDHIFFSNSGSEANDTNIRLVRHFWDAKGKPDKKIIISRKNSYHGSTIGGASLGGMKAMHGKGGVPIPDIVHIDQPYWYKEGGDKSPEEFGKLRAKALEDEIKKLGIGKVAAFIAEPIQGAGGVIIPPDSYWPEISRICREYEILLIADEVICGFGRTGNWFGSDTFNIQPDIMTLAKGLSSGYAPISASVMSNEIKETLNEAGEFSHGFTYSGHTLSCALALENIRILKDEKIIENVRDNLSPYLAKKWGALADHPLVGEAVSKGMMASLELTPDKATRASFPSPGHAGLICRTACFKNQVIIRHVQDRMVISPPLIISKDQIDLLIERAEKSLDDAYSELKKQNLIS